MEAAPRSPNPDEGKMYWPGLDVAPELSTELASYYQSLIGVLRWIVELSSMGICLEVSLLSSHLALPREGHFEQVLQVFYL